MKTAAMGLLATLALSVLIAAGWTSRSSTAPSSTDSIRQGPTGGIGGAAGFGGSAGSAGMGGGGTGGATGGTGGFGR
jgi:hypothetical protein